MSDNSWFKKTYSKEWCQGFCTLCGTSCADYCEKTHELQNQVKELEAHNAQLRDALQAVIIDAIRCTEAEPAQYFITDWSWQKMQKALGKVRESINENKNDE